MSSGFSYTPAILINLEKCLSSERLANYLTLAAGDKELAIRLYLWNTELSESLQMPVHVLEVSLRNAIHRELTVAFGPDWYDQPSCPINRTMRNVVDKVKAALVAEGKPVTPARVISGLTMGFWVFLLSKRYETPLWRPYLYNVFPNASRPFGRSRARQTLDRIRLIRNRTAHHEAILSKDPDQVYALIIDMIGWISTDTADWVQFHCHFDQVWANRPT